MGFVVSRASCSAQRTVEWLSPRLQGSLSLSGLAQALQLPRAQADLLRGLRGFAHCGAQHRGRWLSPRLQDHGRFDLAQALHPLLTPKLQSVSGFVASRASCSAAQVREVAVAAPSGITVASTFAQAPQSIPIPTQLASRLAASRLRASAAQSWEWLSPRLQGITVASILPGAATTSFEPGADLLRGLRGFKDFVQRAAHPSGGGCRFNLPPAGAKHAFHEPGTAVATAPTGSGRTSVSPGTRR